MQRIISPKVKKARAKQEAWQRFKIRWYSRKVIKYLAKQYKKNGLTVINLDIYKFNEDKLIKVLDMLTQEKQITYIKLDDIYSVTLILCNQANMQPPQININPSPTESVKYSESISDEDFEKPFLIIKK